MPSDLTPEQREAAVDAIRSAWAQHLTTDLLGSPVGSPVGVALDALLAAGWRPEPQPDAKAHWQSWAAKRLNNVQKIWVRAAEKALAGDMRELRNRVELHHAEPMDVVLSALEPAQPDAIAAAEARGRREGIEAAAKEVLDWQGRVAMGTTHANAAHDETLARIADHVRALSSIPPAGG